MISADRSSCSQHDVHCYTEHHNYLRRSETNGEGCHCCLFQLCWEQKIMNKGVWLFDSSYLSGLLADNWSLLAYIWNRDVAREDMKNSKSCCMATGGVPSRHCRYMHTKILQLPWVLHVPCSSFIDITTHPDVSVASKTKLQVEFPPDTADTCIQRHCSCHGYCMYPAVALLIYLHILMWVLPVKQSFLLFIVCSATCKYVLCS